MKLYLAGPMTGLTPEAASSWRDDPNLVRALEADGWELLSPLRDKPWLPHGAVMTSRIDEDKERIEVTRDHNDIDVAAALLVNLLGAEIVSIGTIAEMGRAHALGKPIVTVMEPEGNIHDHMFVQEMSTYRCDDMISAVHALHKLGRQLREPQYA